MKHAVVTGAGSGIGEDCCADLLQQGWRVFALDRDLASLKRCEERFANASRSFEPIQCDVRSEAAIQAAFAAIGSEVNHLDALVCSAGVFRTGPLIELAVSQFNELFEVNTRGSWLTAREAFPLLKSGAEKHGQSRIVFVASVAAIRPKIGGGAYAASKVALTQLARVLAVELAPAGILVNAVAPATIDTPMTQQLARNAATSGYTVSGTSPLGRIGQPSDVTGVIRFLLSDASSYVTGAVIPIDGGTSAAFVPK